MRLVGEEGGVHAGWQSTALPAVDLWCDPASFPDEGSVGESLLRLQATLDASDVLSLSWRIRLANELSNLCSAILEEWGRQNDAATANDIGWVGSPGGVIDTRYRGWAGLTEELLAAVEILDRAREPLPVWEAVLRIRDVVGGVWCYFEEHGNVTGEK